ncbi:MAG: efflux RND transporter periplasmic adaptor subunit [Chitinivibrionales bacterium]|nr:efflux RND transporter periplasmic adaptor subunit [Chitinivibrionales bacterium]
MNTRSALIGLSVTTALLWGCAPKGRNAGAAEEEQKAIPVVVATVKPSDFTIYGEYYGKISGIEEATLVCVTGGQVEKLRAKEGTKVKTGSSLGSIESARTENAYQMAMLSEKVAKGNWDRQKKHLEEGNASQLAVDQAELNWLNAKAARIQAAKARKGALCITPISGEVIARFIDLHQEVPPGTPTFTVAQLHKMKVSVGIPESEIEGVSEGSMAEVSFELYPDRTWEGTIKRLSRVLSSQKLTFDAEIHINNTDRALTSGTTAYVKLLRKKLSDKLVVPSEIILSDGTTKYIMAVEDGLAKRHNVIPGDADESLTIIKQGLPFGSKIIVENFHLVQDGSLVKVNRSKS